MRLSLRPPDTVLTACIQQTRLSGSSPSFPSNSVRRVRERGLLMPEGVMLLRILRAQISARFFP